MSPCAARTGLYFHGDARHGRHGPVQGRGEPGRAADEGQRRIQGHDSVHGQDRREPVSGQAGSVSSAAVVRRVVRRRGFGAPLLDVRVMVLGRWRDRAETRDLTSEHPEIARRRRQASASSIRLSMRSGSQLAIMRAMPGINVYRPADAVETAECWALALASHNRPSVLALSRQALPTIDRTEYVSRYGPTTGDRIRLAEMPPEFARPEHALHALEERE